MPYNRVHVRGFLSVSEIELFESSLNDARKALSKAELRRRLQRARTLRDKSRDLLQRQKLATRARTGSKLGVSGQANKRTAQKATAFAEALARFEAETDVRQSAETTAAAKRSASGRAAGSAKAKTAAASKTVATTPTKVKTKASPKTAVKKTGAPVARARPAAVILREALNRKRASEAEQVSAVKRARSAKKNTATVQNSGPGGMHATGPSIRAQVVASRLADANLSHIQGHTSTQVRRNQAKRDQKG